MKNGQHILALDASTTAVGWCVADGIEYVSSGVYVPNGKAEWWQRVISIGQWLGNLLIADQDIGLVVYELATGNRGNMRTHRLLGAVEFECRRQAGDLYRRFAAITASEVRASGCHKKALWAARAIKGGALDEKRAGDEADAIGMWRAYIQKWRRLGDLLRE